jgi:iron complex transport system substrate-binding protein
MTDLRIVSLLPAATEMVCALGLEDQLVGVSHECDFPPTVRAKPVLTRNVLSTFHEMGPAQIDSAVRSTLKAGESLYRIDETLLKLLAPTHVIAQSLCRVCAPSGHDLELAIKGLEPEPMIVWLEPKSLKDVDDNICQVGAVTGQMSEAEALIARNHERIARIRSITAAISQRPRVCCLEWVDPYYCSGHWVPEMVELAGGIDCLGRKGSDSIRVSWEEIAATQPEVLIVMPCGLDLEAACAQGKWLLMSQPQWGSLPALLNEQVFAVDANAYFARPGPRLIDGIELLAHLLHRVDLPPFLGRTFRSIWNETRHN